MTPLVKNFWMKGYTIRMGTVATTVVAIRTALVGGLPNAPQSKPMSSGAAPVRKMTRRSTICTTSIDWSLMYIIALK